ncbi:unnamed protein product [Arctia plantaginis]|uniref:Uncharacterized protein n=1 Tax=Arctia plantaginis TaxID=874455 RepID=A0A8S1AJU9_ARCPL|nr:unnamed protein product [Arctia plantaginis]
MNKNDQLKKSLISTYNFPETQYPSDASTRDYYTLGNSFNTNSFRSVAKKVPGPQCKAVEDLKKDMRMKRKLDKIQEHYHTPEAGSIFTKSLSGPESIILTDKEIFPEVQYPLNAIETWAPHYWNPPQIAQHELEYERPESLIFNQKVSNKSNKSYAPYKKQVKSKVKQFMEDIDMLNEKMHSSKTQYKETQDSNTKNELLAILKSDFNKTDSNNSNILLKDPEALSNETTDPLRNIHEDFVNKSIPENQDFKELAIALNETNNLSPQTETSQLKSNTLDSTTISCKIQDKSSFPLNSEHKNVIKEDIHTFKEERDSSILKVEEELIEKVKLQNPLSAVILTDSADLRGTTITANNTNTGNTTNIESLDQKYNDTDVTSIDDPLNVNIPLPEMDTYDQTPPDFSIETTPLSDTNETPHTTIIVVPVDDYVNMMQIPNFNKLSDSSIIVFTPSKKKNVTATKSSNIFNTLPLIEERNTTTTIPNTRSTAPDFEMLPNNSMCHVLSNKVNSTNMTTKHYSGDEFTDAILISEDIISNTTPQLCATNNSSEIHSESVLPSTKLFNTPIPLLNDLSNRMPSNIIQEPSLLDETVINSKPSEVLIDKVTKQVNHNTFFEVTENSSPSSQDHGDLSLFNNGNNKQFSLEINKLSDNHEANNKVVNSPLTDSKTNGVESLLHTTKYSELTERNQEIVMSKDEQIPIQEDLNYPHNDLTGSNSYKGINYDYISNTEERQPSLLENNEIPSIPLTNVAQSGETLLEINKNEQQMATDELTPNNSVIDLTDIQEGSEPMTLPYAPRLDISLADPASIKQNFHDNLEDTTYLNGAPHIMTSVLEHAQPRNKIHNTAISNENEIVNIYHQSAAHFSNKNRLLHDSKYEERLPPESNVEYSLRFTDNQTLSNTDFDDDEQSLWADNKVLYQIDHEQGTGQKNDFVPNSTLRVPVNIDYITDFKNNSNAVEYQDTIQSHISSAFSTDITNPDKKNVPHAEINMSLLPIDSHQNEGIENEPLVDTPPKYSVNKSHELMKEVLTVLNNISEDDTRDRESTTLLNSSEKAIQETYSTDIIPELIYNSELDNFTGRDKRLLTKNSLTDPPMSNNKKVKTFPATLLNDIVNFNPLEVDKLDSDKSLTDNIIEKEAINELFDANPMPIYTDYRPLLVNETLSELYNEEELIQTDIAF